MMVMDKLSRVQQHRLLAPALLGAVLLLSGCGGADSPTGPSGPSGLVVGSGVRVTQERAVGSFSEVVFGVVGRLIIEQTGRDSLAITADDNLLPLLRSDVIGGRLVLDVRDDVGGIAAIGEVTFRLTVRDLAEIDASGAVPVFVEVIAIDAAALTVRRWKKLHLGVDGSGVVFRLPLRQAEGFVRSVPSSMERQRSLDREIRESLLPAGSTGRRSSPPVPRVGRKLQRHVTSLHECSLVLRPVSDAVFGLVRGVDSRLHDEIVRHGPSTRPGHRTRPQARG